MSDAKRTESETFQSNPKQGLLASLGQIAQEKALGVALIGSIVAFYAYSQQMATGNFVNWFVTAVIANFVISAITVFPSRHSGCSRIAALKGKRAWFDRTILIRFVTTPIALGSSVVLAIWSFCNAKQEQMPGDIGTVLVLVLVTTMGIKLAAEMYLLSWTGVIHENQSGEAHERSAKLLIGRYSRWTTCYYVLASLGGIIMPLGTQILASGAKNIPSAANPGPSLVLALAAVACLVPAEIIARWLYYRITNSVVSSPVVSGEA